MHWYLIATIVLNINSLGFVVLSLISVWGIDHSKLLNQAKSYEFLSPAWVYKHNNHKVLSAMALSGFFNLLCPIFSIIFWVSKIFRKNS